MLFRIACPDIKHLNEWLSQTFHFLRDCRSDIDSLRHNIGQLLSENEKLVSENEKLVSENTVTVFHDSSSGLCDQIAG